MQNNGYGSTKKKSEQIAAALRDMALLIGEPATDAVELETGGTFVPGLGLTSDAHDLSRRARDIQQGIFKVLVLGEFKNGKSTLLNATLGSKVLPAKVTPATAIITVLVYGEGKEVAIYENGQATPRSLSWAAFDEEFKLNRSDIETLDKTGYLDRFQNVDYAQLETTHPFCANGVRLIDSPGLGEQASRTRLTTNFLKQAHAVIFVLNATRILSEDEKKFIETRLGAGRLNQVFFVVNRVNQIDADGVQDVKEWVQSVLKHHFTNEKGEFDQGYYERRVFFVNALGALEARLTNPLDQEALDSSGLPALEHELEQFLTSEDKVRAVLETSVHSLSGVVDEACKRISQQRSSLDQPLADLEKHRDEAEEKLKTLEIRKEEIQRTILLFGNLVKQRIYSNLRNYLEDMRNNWSRDSQTYINLDEVLSITEVLQTLISKEAEGRIAAALEIEVKKYLRTKLAEWAENMPAIIQEDIAKMMTEVEAQVESFQLELDQIGEMFAGQSPDEFAGQKRGDRIAQLLMSFGEIGQVAEATFNEGDWSGLFGRMLQQIVTLVVIFGIFSGPLAWIILMVVEAWYLFLHKEKLKQKLLEKLGDRLYTELQSALPAKQAEIYKLVEGKFEQFAAHVSKTLQDQVDEKRAEIERILRQKKDATFSIEQEKRRLNAIGAKLLELAELATTETYGDNQPPAMTARLLENRKILAGESILT